jgi:hypothetical protein
MNLELLAALALMFSMGFAVGFLVTATLME